MWGWDLFDRQSDDSYRGIFLRKMGLQVWKWMRNVREMGLKGRRNKGLSWTNNAEREQQNRWRQWSVRHRHEGGLHFCLYFFFGMRREHSGEGGWVA